MTLPPNGLYILPGCPLPWKAPFVGTRGTFSPRHAVMIEYRKILANQHQGDLLDEAIVVDLFFYMPIPKSASKKKRELMLSGDIRPEGTPDRTNTCKLAEDCLQGSVIKNDSKIVDGRVGKWYSDNPRTEIYITRLKDMKNRCDIG
ncbi:MAG: RusA family crossover junction endodeoxyribonuclease [Patescibacteria group bacterium]